jgi:histidyl-tRNA synthetase
MNKKGTIVMLPESLTVNFARSVARSGNAATRVKRYCFDKVFHDSLAGGHPRENFEASFDVVFEDQFIAAECLEAEAFMVICQSIGSLKCSSPWYLRLTHTRLADSILDFCGVPVRLRNICLRLLGYGSCSLLSEFTRDGHKTLRRRKGAGMKNIDRHFDQAIKHHDLPVEAAHRLRTYLSGGCFPLPANASEAIDALEAGTRRLRLRDIHNKDTEPKRTKKYEEIGRAINSLRKFLGALHTFGISVPFETPQDAKTNLEMAHSSPFFIAIDLGIRQDEGHFHGSIFFQAFMFNQDVLRKCIEKDEQIVQDDDALLISGIAVKIAEGGRYDDLVRKYRPPGSDYSTAPIPVAVGVGELSSEYITITLLPLQS